LTVVAFPPSHPTFLRVCLCLLCRNSSLGTQCPPFGHIHLLNSVPSRSERNGTSSLSVSSTRRVCTIFIIILLSGCIVHVGVLVPLEGPSQDLLPLQFIAYALETCSQAFLSFPHLYGFRLSCRQTKKWLSALLPLRFRSILRRPSTIHRPPSRMSQKLKLKLKQKPSLAQPNELFRFNLLYWDWLWASGEVKVALRHTLLEMIDPNGVNRWEVQGRSSPKFQFSAWWHPFIHKTKLQKDKWKCLWFLRRWQGIKNYRNFLAGR